MDIYVTGIGEEKFAPDQIRIVLTFQSREKTYAEAYEKGLRSVEEFVRKVLPAAKLKKKDFISTYFNVSVEKEYEEEKRRYVDCGYVFHQGSYIEFDYDMKKASKVIEMINTLENAPEYNLQFSLKEDKEAEEATIRKAYEDAKRKAEVLAKEAGCALGRCKKSDLNHTSLRFQSNTSFDMVMAESTMANGAMRSLKSSVAEVFTPEEITISESVYCVFEAE